MVIAHKEKDNLIIQDLDNKYKEKVDIKKLVDDKNKVVLKDNKVNLKKNKVIYFEKVKKQDLCVYVNNNKINVIKTKDFYKSRVRTYSKVLNINKFGKHIYINFIAYIKSKMFNVNDIEDAYLEFGNKRVCDIKIKKVYNKKLRKKRKIKDFFKINYTAKVPINKLFEEDVQVNSSIKICIEINGAKITYPLVAKKTLKDNRYAYLPSNTIKYGKYIGFFRKSITQGLVFVKREIEQDEKNIKFKFYESKFMSLLFSSISKIYRLFSKRNINIYFEKEAAKAEEGVYELFERVNAEYKNSSNYFIINKQSVDFDRIKKNKNVIAKYSLKYYLIIYLCNNVISSDSPSHVNILRSSNRILKKSILDKEFIFLQHGITYLKDHGKNSPYITGKEAQIKYVCVSSKKERDIVSQKFKLDIDKIWITGMLVFDNIKHEHVNCDSEDKIVIMLTWKPYEEHLEKFEDSSYYKNTLDIYNLLLKYTAKENIIIVPHPKVKGQMLNTIFSESVYNGQISEALTLNKLLITDYSSVCYNSFYQGAGVVFFQEDLELYESKNGKLIPNDNEYIGYRTYSVNDLENKIKEGIIDSKIDLKYFRSEKFINNYKAINEFYDGENIKRIIEQLVRNSII